MKGRWAAILSGWLVGGSLTDWLVGRMVALVGTLRCSTDWPEMTEYHIWVPDRQMVNYIFYPKINFKIWVLLNWGCL